MNRHERRAAAARGCPDVTSEWTPDTTQDDDHQPGWLTYTTSSCPACGTPSAAEWSIILYIRWAEVGRLRLERCEGSVCVQCRYVPRPEIEACVERLADEVVQAISDRLGRLGAFQLPN